MMTSNIRWVVITLALVLLLFAAYRQQYEVVAMVTGGVGYLLWSYYREGTVFLATQAFQNKDYEKAARLLDDIRQPEYLRKGRRNYYEFMRANIALKEEDFERAERHFQLASRLPFRRQNDKAIILVNLANINLRKKDYERVKAYIDLVRDLETSSRIKHIVEKINNELPNN